MTTYALKSLPVIERADPDRVHDTQGHANRPQRPRIVFSPPVGWLIESSPTAPESSS